MKIRGIEYHVEVTTNNEDADTLVLLHGFTGSTKSWIEVVKEFPSYNILLIDIIGHGETESPLDSSRYTMKEVVEDIVTILDNLHLDRVYMLGYSMGGRLALSFATAYPKRVKRLILESSSPGIDDSVLREDRKHADQKLAEEITRKGIVEFVNKWENIPLFLSQKRLPAEKRERIRKQRLKNSPVGLSNSLMGMGTGTQPSLWTKLSCLKIPVLILCGEQDKKFCEIAKKMQNLLENSIIKEINSTGHAIHVEQPHFFGKIVNEFLSSRNDLFE
ncbi:2-succinyl-6-hydroxy-2,4-cyclohexadiene-1-carboxylate synthase [Metabacillus litoralis]|uniref:2-succinyl-6-hydroxy-2, 4-cyclohexadiene-1-carboxylate synthase n=1 Tax=Metabacillus litoralis TaxID=152268 RepID=UPI001CFE119D|nr:2-succinyl-6-hydroxy-2,4-cyclohexadiene-1-carboxylate synthase [Metabacillus litoralis]